LKVPILIGTSEGERAFIGVREVVAVVASMREELDHPIFTYSRAPRSTEVTPLRRYYGPILHPLAFDRFPGLARLYDLPGSEGRASVPMGFRGVPRHVVKKAAEVMRATAGPPSR
jgi:hypothetical protein